MKALSFLFAASLTLVSFSLHADQTENSWNELSKEVESMKIPSDQDLYKMLGEKEPVAMTSSPMPMTQSTPPPTFQHYTFYGDMLYWKPIDTSTMWALKLDRTNLPFTTETTYPFKFSWDFGFRLGFVYKMPWNKLILDLNWTRFHTTSHNVHQDLTILQTLQTPVNTVNYNINLLNSALYTAGAAYKITGAYTIKWDQIDLAVRKKLNFDSRFSLVPYGGLRLLMDRSRLKMARYTDFWGAIEVTQPPVNSATMELYDSFTALGLLGGINGQLVLGRGFNLFLTAGGYIGSAIEHGHNNGQSFSGSTSPAATRDIHRARQINLKTMIDMACGFDWKRNFYDGRYGIGLAAAYEFHVLFASPAFTYDANFSSSTTDQTTNTQLQGLTIRGSFNF